MEDINIKNKANNYRNSVIIILLLIIIVFVIYFITNRNQAKLGNENSQQSEIDALRRTVDDLKNSQSEIGTSTSKQVTYNTTNIVKEWSPVIPIVVCNFRDLNGTVLSTSSGSAVLVEASPGGSLEVFTNRHVVTDGINNVNDCSLKFPNDPQIFSAPTINIGVDPNGADAATITISNPDANLKELIKKSTRKFCASSPSIGDQIVILGYPAIGSSYGITATDGIISGYDGDYYVTSAKVDHGNSGGVAIDIKNNCDLGIPTMVIAGNLESLARILKWEALFTNDPDMKARAANSKL